MDKITFSKIRKKCCANARKKPPRLFDRNAFQGSNKLIKGMKASNTGYKYTRTCNKNLKLYFKSKGFICGTQTLSEFINSDECNPPEPIIIKIDPRNVIKWDNRKNSWEHYVKDNRKFFNPVVLNTEFVYDIINKWDVKKQEWFLINPNEIVYEEIENETTEIKEIVLRDNIFKVTMTDDLSNNTIFYLRYLDDGRGLNKWKYWKNWTLVPDIPGISSVAKNTFSSFQVLASRDSVNLFRTTQFMNISNNPFVKEVPKPNDFKDQNNLFVWDNLYINNNYKNFTYRIEKINPDTIPNFYGFDIPKNLSAVSFQDRQSLVNWGASNNYTIENIDGYRIEVKGNEDDAYIFNKDVSGNVFSTIITGLTNGIKYFFKVYPFTNSTSKNIQIVQSITTSTPGSVPRNPINLTGKGNLIREEFLTWFVRENISGFEIIDFEIQTKKIELGVIHPWSEKIIINKNNLPPIYSNTTTNIEYEYTIPNLQNGTTYQYRIRSRNILGYSSYEYSSGIGIKTADTPASPSFDSVPLSVTQPLIDISWNKPFDGGRSIIGYKIDFSTQPNGPWSIFKNNTKTTDTNISLTFGCLKPATYWFRVAAINSVGLGKYGFSVNYRTDGDGVIYHEIPRLPTGLLVLIQRPFAIDLYWNNPDIFLGADITDHSVGYSSDSGSTWIYKNTGTYQTNYTIKDLNEDTEYQIKVATKNAAGLGEYTTAKTIRTATKPVQPVITALTSPLLSIATLLDEITLSWDKPYTALPLLSYNIRYRDINTPGAPFTNLTITDTTLTTKTITNLNVGSNYEFQIAATNAVGISTYDISNIQLLNVSNSPTFLFGSINSRKDGSIDLTWNTPTDIGSSSLISYNIQVKKTDEPETEWRDLDIQPSGLVTNFEVDISEPKIEISATDENIYVFRIAALNGVGLSQYSNKSNNISCGERPGNTENFSVTPIFGVGSMYFTWDPPTYDGGSRIFSYKVEYKLSSGSTWTSINTNTSADNYTINNLTTLTDYDFRVTAQNSIDFGITPTSFVTSRTAGSANSPTNLTILVKDEEVILNWTEPSDNGGLPISSYDVSGSDTISGTIYPIRNTGNNNTNYTYGRLTNGTNYKFSVRAITGNYGSSFQSPYSNIITGTPTTPIYSYPDTSTCGGVFQYSYISSIQYDLANNIVKLKIDSSYNEVGVMDQYGNILSTDKYVRRAQINVSQTIYTYNEGFCSPVTDTIPIQGRSGLRLPLYNGNDDPRSGFFQYKMMFSVEYEDNTTSPPSWIQISGTSGALVYIGDILAPSTTSSIDQDKNIYINVAGMLTSVFDPLTSTTNNFTQVERWSGFLSGKNIRITYLSGGTTP